MCVIMNAIRLLLFLIYFSKHIKVEFMLAILIITKSIYRKFISSIKPNILTTISEIVTIFTPQISLFSVI